MYPLSRLKSPFAPADIEWRVQQAGKKGDRIWAQVLAYVTNRAIMDRLDEVFGPENWQNTFQPGPDGGIVCAIGVYFEDRGWVLKQDGAENTDIEAVKGGLSNSMKRAAVQWGVGRYLYKLESGWANVHPEGRYRAKTKDGTWFNWDPPELPSWALPGAKAFVNETADDMEPEGDSPHPPSENPDPSYEPEEGEKPKDDGSVKDSDPPRADTGPGATAKQRKYLKTLYGGHKELMGEPLAERMSKLNKKPQLTKKEASEAISWLVEKFGKPDFD